MQRELALTIFEEMPRSKVVDTADQTDGWILITAWTHFSYESTNQSPAVLCDVKPITAPKKNTTKSPGPIPSPMSNYPKTGTKTWMLFTAKELAWTQHGQGLFHCCQDRPPERTLIIFFFLINSTYIVHILSIDNSMRCHTHIHSSTITHCTYHKRKNKSINSRNCLKK